MSLFPYFFRDMIRPLRMMENQLRLTEEMFRQSFATPIIARKNSPFLENLEQNEAVIHDKDKFQVKLDVQDFKPEEIKITTVDGNAIQIDAKHEEKHDNYGFISKQFVRRFVLPKGHELKDVVSSLSADGVLTVTAPRKVPAIEQQERVIPITHTGPEKPSIEEKKKD